MKKEHLKGGIVIGLFLFLAFYVQTVGLQYTTPSNNAFITASNVVMVPFLWWIISKKRPSLKIFISSFYVCLESEFYRLTFPPESRLNWEIC